MALIQGQCSVGKMGFEDEMVKRDGRVNLGNFMVLPRKKHKGFKLPSAHQEKYGEHLEFPMDLIGP